MNMTEKILYVHFVFLKWRIHCNVLHYVQFQISGEKSVNFRISTLPIKYIEISEL